MEQISAEKKPSGIPRLSRLPVPNLRSTASSRRPQGHERQAGMPGLVVPKGRLTDDVSTRSDVHSAHDAGVENATPAKEENVPNREEGLPMSDPYAQNRDDNLHAIDDLKDGSAMGNPLDATTGLPNAQDPIKEDDRGAKARTTAKSKPRPSLAERTVQTISQIPPSPSPRRRRSSFYQSQSPMRPPSAAGHELRQTPRLASRGPSGLSRPDIGSPTPKPSGRGPSIGGSRAVSLSHKRPDVTSRLQSDIRPQSASSNSRAISSRPPNKASVQEARSGTLRKVERTPAPRVPPIPSAYRVPERVASGQNRPKPEATARGKGPSRALRKPPHQFPSTTNGDQSQSGPEQPATSLSKVPKSSAALRDSIAKAKAAKRNSAGKGSAPLHKGSPLTAPSEAGMGSLLDNLDLQDTPAVGKSLFQRIESARTDGRLDVSVMGLRELPDEVLNMYSPEALSASKSAWYETVELTRFAAADNELEHIDPRVFPGMSTGRDPDDENPVLFAALESLDLHGNQLRTVPAGMGCLGALTTLNLSHNKLSNDCLDVIVGCQELRDLNLAHNELSGALDPSISRLGQLASLDLSSNALTSIPDEFTDLTQLRKLNLSHNDLGQASLNAILDLQLTELNASHNQLSAPLISRDCEILNSLQTLNLSNNRLTALADSSSGQFGTLREINLSNNRITSLPDLSGWAELLTMDLSDNQLSSIPAGFTSLKKVKQVSLRGNNLRTLDPRIGLMESLENLQLSGNPLRSRRALTLVTEDLKADLRSQLEPESEDAGLQDAPVPAKPLAESTSDDVETQAPKNWPVSSGGVVDRSSTGLETIDESVLQATAADQAIRRLELHHNQLCSIPAALSILGGTLTQLDLSHNKLPSDLYLVSPLDLPHLQTLKLSCNNISTLAPLISHLSAARLSTLDVSANQLSTLIPLRATYPSLTTLVASDNSISDLSVDAIKGLEVVDLGNNDIGHVPPNLGLLKGLQRLDLAGNRFKVPSWAVLQKGTPALLEWLRGKIPAGEGADGDEEVGHGDRG